MDDDIDEILADSDEIAKMVREAGAAITRDYKGRELVVVGILKGAFVFLSDLIREIGIPIYVDFIAVSSYGDDTRTSGVVKIVRDIDMNINAKDVLIVEDLVDTGLTLKYISELFKTRNPASLRICTAFDKPSRRKADLDVDYCGMIIPDKFVVGYGLDFAGKYRNLPCLCTLKPERGFIVF